VNVLVEPPVRKLEARSAVPVTATWAEFWPWAKIPKTKPPIATEAIRVTAMISTVAMIGEMARLCPFFPYRGFIGVSTELYSLY